MRPSINRGSSSRRYYDQSTDDHDNSPIPQSDDISLPTAASQSSTSSHDLPPVQRQALTERGQLLLNFHDVISRAINSPEMIRKCSQIAADMMDHDVMTSQQSARSLASNYSAEANLIVENKSRRDAEVRNKTISVGLCVFGMLRGGRGLSSMMRKVAVNRGVVASRYKFDSLPSSISVARVNSMPTKPPTSEQPTKLRRFLRVSVDLTISTTLALLCGKYFFTPRPSSYIEDMAKLPMVEGKSLYAEMVCPPLLREYKHVLEKYGRWPIMSADNVTGKINPLEGKRIMTQEDVSLNIIRNFVENCTKRSKFEQAILNERNTLKNHRCSNQGQDFFHRITKKENLDNQKDEWIKLGDVMLPSGGVPENIEVDLDNYVLSLTDENSDK